MDYVRDYVLEAILVLRFALAVLAEGLSYAILPSYSGMSAEAGRRASGLPPS
jgi:hypothetical protein